MLLKGAGCMEEPGETVPELKKYESKSCHSCTQHSNISVKYHENISKDVV